MKNINLCDNKYIFYTDEDGSLYCKRNGEDWRDFIGDKAVSALFDECFRLKQNEDILIPIVRNITDLDPEISKILNENFWNLIEK